MPSHRRIRDARRAERREARLEQLAAPTARSGGPPGAQRPLQPNERNAFVCGHCGRPVGQTVSGGHHRNHCPHCLYSLHVDDRTMGDRTSACGGLMEPIARFRRPKGEEVVVHRCLRCGQERHNRVAADDRLSVLRGLPEVEPRQTVRGAPADAIAPATPPGSALRDNG